MKVCARGSLPPPLFCAGGGGGGGGGLLTVTVTCAKVLTIPLAEYEVSALEINRLPGSGIAFVELEVTLNDFVPVVILTSGGGDAKGFLIKNDP